VICPTCGADYVPGFTECSDCLMPLVDSLPEPKPKPQPDPVSRPNQHPAALTDAVCVYRSGHRGRLAVAKSVLQSADVPFVVLNEALQTLTGLVGIAPVEILVSAEDAEDARLLLAELGKVAAGSHEDESDADAQN
jgi:Putative prokaryotic signal transducing protein